MSSSDFLQILEAWKIEELEMRVFWASTSEKRPPPTNFFVRGFIQEVDSDAVQIFHPDPGATEESPRAPLARAFISLEGAAPEGAQDPRHVRLRFASGAVVDFVLG